MTPPIPSRIWHQHETDFALNLDKLLAARGLDLARLSERVAALIDEVKQQGDAAILRLTAQYDGFAVPAMADLRVSDSEIEAAEQAITAAQAAALDLAAARIRDFHLRQRPENLDYVDATGVRLGLVWRPIDAAGIYVPGGKASYPSSVLMNAIPARVAGVERLVMMVPSPQGELNPLVLAAARRAGVTEIWRIGGAQAVAALAFGTASIAAVDMICGPGNDYVATAKKLVFGQVGIDAVAGPSEVLILADAAAGINPHWLAADLLAQAEHDEHAQAILITDDGEYGRRVADAVADLLAKLPRGDIAAASWRDFGAILVVKSLASTGVDLANRIAAEHVELAMGEGMAETIWPRIRHAGAIFLGPHTPEAIGDYVGGPNHVLPTGGTARFTSGLGVFSFMKRTSLLGCSPSSLAAQGGGLIGLADAAITLAEAEGLHAHAESVRVRLNQTR